MPPSTQTSSARSRLLPPRPLLLALPLAFAAVLAGCSDDAGGSGSGTDVAVVATDDACELDDTDLPAGDVTFAVTNEGAKVTEVYVYGEEGSGFTKVVGEVENIGPGTSRDLDVELAAGAYEVACKPGQRGDGIRQRVTVTGAGGGATGSGGAESEGGGGEAKGYDRELELAVDGAELTGLGDATARTGERIEFKLAGSGNGTRKFELLDPAGRVVAGFEVSPGGEGEAIVELAEAGDWTVKVADGPTDIESTLTVS